MVVKRSPGFGGIILAIFFVSLFSQSFLLKEVNKNNLVLVQKSFQNQRSFYDCWIVFALIISKRKKLEGKLCQERILKQGWWNKRRCIWRLLRAACAKREGRDGCIQRRRIWGMAAASPFCQSCFICSAARCFRCWDTHAATAARGCDQRQFSTCSFSD